MITLEIHINGKRLCRAGVGPHGVVTAVTTWMNRAARTRDGDVIPGKFEEAAYLAVMGGCIDAEGGDLSLDWGRPTLRVGDEVRITVVDGRRPTKPRSQQREDPQLVEKARRRHFERLKREFAKDEAEAKPQAKPAKRKPAKRKPALPKPTKRKSAKPSARR
jgi:hypothetical protein